MRGGTAPGRLWVFDFDGTLSPIVPDRNAAGLHPASRGLLRDLSAQDGDRVAVLSSRALPDLVPRVPVPGVYLGGGSGVEWRFPGGHRAGMGNEAVRRAESARAALLPLLAECAKVPGVEIEDKYWSAAVHHRKVSPDGWGVLEPLLMRLRSNLNIHSTSGPCVEEYQVLREVNKAMGIQRLCRLLRFDPTRGGVLYAGDDENDGIAMRWVLARRGRAFAVGGRGWVPGARVVAGPSGLARAVRALAENGGTGCVLGWR
ncbi:MAG: trehalose-phosphatase [Deltaproteobacteria bacterium GWC2_65_14]|nr:MAG: trehalose-phosphatase [Deltaproteobacteria bacterium GWC2_65_14]